MRLTATRSSLSGSGAVLDPITQEDPTLDLNFADSKTLRDDVDSNNPVTFTRASSATYVGADGLIKTTPVNLLTYSEEFDDAVWLLSTSGTGSAPVVTTNYGTAPDGTNTADRVQFDKGAGNTVNDFSILANNSFNSVVGQPLTQSVYMRTLDGSSKTFDFSFSGISPDSGNQTVVVTGDWQRFVITLNSATDTSRHFRLSLRGTFGTSDTADILIWGAQAEVSTTATAYIPTTNTISGAPRFDHDPATGESLGLLIEESRTNLVADSVGGDIFSTTNMTGPTSVDGPGGDNTAFQYLSTGGTGVPSRIQFKTITAANATQYTATIYVKGVNYNQVNFGFGATGFISNSRKNFFLDTLTTDPASGGAAELSIEDAGNGWRRLRVTTTATTSATGITAYLDLGNNAPEDHTTDQGFQFYGFQIETGTFPTSYIPTSGTTVTRAADVAEITGADFAKTNLFQYSERFDQSVWTKQNLPVVTPNQVEAPDGTLTADLLQFTNVNQRLFQTVTGAGTYTLSIYARVPSGSESFYLNVFNGTDGEQSELITVNDTWQRFSTTFTVTAGSQWHALRLVSAPSEVYIWGAQLEEGDVLTDYTPSVESFDSRASSATYVDDATGLIKTTPVNLITRSEEFDQWISSNVTVTANSELSPTGTQTADRCVNVIGQLSNIQNITNLAYDTNHTISVYAKPFSSNQVVAFEIGGVGGVVVNLGTGVFSGASIESGSVEDVGDGWKKVVFTFLTPSSGTSRFQSLYLGNYGPSGSTSDVAFWGFQLEEGTTATPYIKTTSTISGAARYENGELILEEAATNLMVYSQELNQWNAFNGASVTPNAITAPDGTLTADLIDLTAGGSAQVNNSFTAAPSTTYTVSFWAKSTAATDLLFLYRANGGSASINITNEWQRYTSTYTTDATSPYSNVLFLSSGSSTNQYYVWGVQVEEAPFASSYIPTTTATVTRAADVSTSALGVDSFYNQSEGTVFVDWHKSWKGSFTSYTPIFKTYNTGGNLAQITWGGQTNAGNGNQIYYIVSDSSGANEMTYIPYTIYDSTSDYKAAFALATNDAVVAQGGSVIGTDTSINVPTMEAGRFDAANFHIKRLSYFPTRLTDATLQDITS